MARRHGGVGSVLVDAAIGAVSGLAASWVMEKAQARIMAVGSERTKAREREAQGDLEPATVRAAESAARLLRRPLPDERKARAAEVVHYATGAAFGGLFGLIARRVAAPALAAGAAFGLAVWLLNDEALTPALGLARGPWAYPPSTHAKALASHLVYGAATDVGYRVLHAAMR